MNKCHNKELEAEASDVEITLCFQCGTMLTTPRALRERIADLEQMLEDVPSFIKRIFI